VYLTEPYVGQSYVSPEYVEPANSTFEDTLTNQYTAPPTQTVPSPQIDPSQPLPETADAYQTLNPVEQQRTIVSDANNAFAAGRYEEAKGLYVRAVMTDERDGYAKTLYAWANFALGDYEAAAAALRRALLTTPDLVDYPLDLRTLYPDRAILDRHSDALMRFLADHPQHREAQLLWGYLLYSIGQAEPAATVFSALAGADQDDTLLSLLRDAAVRNARGSSPPPAAP
jgi:tetratricopeptide (TPR) repeat protein